MAKEIDELIIQISADTRGLKTELDKVKRKIDGTFPSNNRSPVAGFAAQLKGLLGPLAGVAGGLAAIGAVKGIAAVGDEFEALNITLGRLYGGSQAGLEAFEEISHFAQTTPFQLEDVTRAFIQLKGNGIEPNTDMLTTFGDAASAALNPLEAFNALIRITQRAAGGGLGLEELEQLVNQGLPVYSILNNELGKSRLELSEFGKTAEGAAVIMDSLRTGLEKEFGGIMVDRMELLSTKTSNFEIALKGLQNEIFQGGLGQTLKDLADDMTEFVNGLTAGVRQSNALAAANKNLPKSVQDALRREGGGRVSTGGQMRIEHLTVEEAVQESLLELEAERARLNEKLTADTERNAKKRGAMHDNTRADLTAELQAVALQIKAIEDLNAARAEGDFSQSGEGAPPPATPQPLSTEVIEASALMTKLLKDTVTEAEELEAQFKALDLVIKEGQLGAEDAEKLREHLNGLAAELKEAELDEQFGHLKSEIEGLVTPAEALTQKIAELQAIIDSGNAVLLGYLFGTDDPEQINVIMAKLSEELEDLNTKTDETAETFKTTLAPAIQSMSLSFTNEFVQSLMDAGNALDAFKNLARNIVSQIISTFLQMAVVNKILNQIFGGGTFSELNFNGDGLFGMGITPATKQASGGAMMRGRPYLVGERGAELFIPNVAGTLKNAADTRGVGGGPPIIINQNLNFSTGVVPTVRAEVQKLLPSISETTKQSVLDATRRGGAYRRGLLGA